MSDLVTFINALALLVILGIAICRLNVMHHMTTRLPLRAAYVALSVGAFSALMAQATWECALLHVGIAAVLIADARKPVCYQPEPRACDR